MQLIKRFLLYAGCAAVVFCCRQHAVAGDKPSAPPTEKTFIAPSQITSEGNAVTSFDVAPDGNSIVYAVVRDGAADLWQTTTSAAGIAIPEQITDDPASEIQPAVAPDGCRIAYVGTDDDVRGDIYLFDRCKPDTPPVRLTGREAGDGAPCFSPDGAMIFFHQRSSDFPQGRIVSMKLDNPADPPVVLDTGGAALYPAVSPDGAKMAYVCVLPGPNTRIQILDLGSGSISSVTDGSAIDGPPRWSEENGVLYFTRVAMDTNRDGNIDNQDHAVLYRVGPDGRPKIVTPSDQSVSQVRTAGDRLFFLTEAQGVMNCFSLPATGMIPLAENAAGQMAVAESIAADPRADVYITLLAYAAVLDRWPNDHGFSDEAAYRMGNIYRRLNFPDAAIAAYKSATGRSGAESPVSVRAEIAAVVTRVGQAVAETPGSTEKSLRIDAAAQSLSAIGKTHGEAFDNRIRIEQARLEILKGDAGALSEAIRQLENVITDSGATVSEVNEATVLKADLFQQLGREDDVYPLYLSVARDFKHTPVWSEMAVAKILDLMAAEKPGRSLPTRIRALRVIAEENTDSAPVLTAAALNRMGDLYYAAEDWPRARAVYREVIDRFPRPSRPSAAARLSLAEILYREERFRDALALYKDEIYRRPEADHIRRLAEEGYIRKSIAAAEYEYRLGEVLAAQNRFKAVMDYKDTVVEAHRGYIKCAAALNRIPERLALYNGRVMENSRDLMGIYGKALCLTYQDGKSALLAAKDLLEQVVRMNARIEYFHQTLGYVYETLETVHGESGRLEAALRQYRKALFLNDPSVNADNRAHLLLNLGNVHFLLKQYRSAYDTYRLRAEADTPFSQLETALAFYLRYGASAFQISENAAAVSAYEMALERLEGVATSRKAVHLMDDLHRWLMNQVLMPGLNHPESAREAKQTSEKQSALHLRLSRIADAGVTPFEPGWSAFRDEISSIMNLQTGLISEFAELAGQLNVPGTTPEMVRETIGFRLKQVEKALTDPERFARLKAELTDRLGLALQESGRWEAAAEQFEQAFKLNSRLGLDVNLVRNRRQVAYNLYMSAGEKRGKARLKQLRAAAEYFRETLTLLNTFGVQEKQPMSGDALYSMSVQVALDKTRAGAAGLGFSREQEQRLSQAFLSRIYLELGQTEPAWQRLEKQLQEYPENQPVADADLYGVSLLYHRAGLMRAAKQHWQEAFNDFLYSGKLAGRLENAVSTALNVMNAGRCLLALPPETAVPMLRKFRAAGRETGRLMREKEDLIPLFFQADYHNAMGFYHSIMTGHVLSDRAGQSVKAPAAAVESMRLYQQAVHHFSAGIACLGRTGSVDIRKHKNLEAVLHLNMAVVAEALASPGSMRTHLESALAIARDFLLPDIEWRALSRLGRIEAAREALAGVTILRADCAPFELIAAFQGQVSEWVAKGDLEAAFNLAAFAAEQERFQRTAFLAGRFGEGDRRLLTTVRPRIERIRALRSDAEAANGEVAAELKDDLAREQRLLAEQIGETRENLPGILRHVADTEMREQLMLLLGNAADAENIADQFARATDSVERSRLKNAYDRRIAAYQQLWASTAERQPGDSRADWPAFFGPVRVEAGDVAAVLPPDMRLMRLFGTGGSDAPPVVFTIMGDNLSARQYPGIAAALDAIAAESAASDVTAVYEDPRILPGDAAIGLNTAHVIRSYKHRKAFKRNLLAIPMQPDLPDSYQPLVMKDDTFQAAAFDPEALSAADIGNTQLLLLSDPAGSLMQVPTRAGDAPASYPGIRFSEGMQLPLEAIWRKTPDTALTVLTTADSENAYIFGHMASIYHCPAVLMPHGNPGGAFLTGFLKAYPDAATLDAKREAESRDTKWMLLGDMGMLPEEAAEFLDAYILQAVKDGRRAFADGRAAEAFFLFENAVLIARENAKYTAYLPSLYRFCRESAYKAGKLDKALLYAEQLSDWYAAQQPDTEAHAEALLRLGLVHAALEKHQVAAETIETAVEILSVLEITDERATALASLGVVFENSTAYDRALQTFRAAADVSAKAGKKELMAVQHENIGRINDLRLSQYPAAIEHYRAAAGLYRQTGSIIKAARNILNIGRCNRLLGDFEGAAQAYAEAAGMMPENDDTAALRATILLEQANNDWFQSRYEAAFTRQRAVYQIAREHSLPAVEVMALNTGGLIWWTLGRYERALDTLERALTLARENAGVRENEIASTLNNMGLVYRDMAQYKKALAAFDQALEIDLRIKSRWAAAYDYRNKGLTYLRMEKAEEAIPLFQTAVQESHAIGNRINEAKALQGLADAFRATGDASAAGKAYRKALAMSRDMYLRETEWRSLYGLAKVLLDNSSKAEGDADSGSQSKRARAETYLRDAVEVIEGMRAEIKIEQLKEAFVDDKMSVYETLVGLLVDQGKNAAAFEMAERSRSRNFIDLLGNQRLSLRNTTDQDLYDRQQRIRNRLEGARKRLALARAQARAAEITQYEEQVQELRNAFSDTLIDMQTQNPALSAFVTVSPLRANDLSGKLSPETALAVYYVLPDEILCWILKGVKDNKADLVLVRTAVDRDTLGNNILIYRRLIQNLEPLEERSKWLYAALLKKIRPHLDGIRYLGIVPHGALHYLSFATLTDGRRFLIDDMSLFYLPGASVWEYTKQRRVDVKNLNVLAVGNPDLKDPALSLPFAEHEVASIKWRFPNITILTGERATESWVRENLASFGIVHIATHGAFDAVNPLFSEIKLAKDAGKDGDLEAIEIFGLDLNADMVVLSACQTGLGKVTGGDDVIGMNRAFLYAGTHTIVSSLWRVSDVATAVLVKSFYRHYVDKNKADSLRRAILHVKNRYSHPGYWGAFTLVGDYQ